jgi:hypothetical protein
MDTASASGKGNGGPARWSLRLFGGFELAARPGGENLTALGKRERVLLAALALSSNGRQPRRRLATLLWGDATDETALDNLRTCIWSLRKALGDAGRRVLVREGEDIVLDVTAFEVDALVPSAYGSIGTCRAGRGGEALHRRVPRRARHRQRGVRILAPRGGVAL